MANSGCTHRMFRCEYMACLRPFSVCNRAIRSPLELVVTFFGCSSVDAERCLGRTSDLLVYGDHPNGLPVYGDHPNGYFEKVQWLHVSDVPTLAFQQASYLPMNVNFISLFQ